MMVERLILLFDSDKNEACRAGVCSFEADRASCDRVHTGALPWVHFKKASRR
jgi:chloramphenicol O-acetyltransferase